MNNQLCGGCGMEYNTTKKHALGLSSKCPSCGNFNEVVGSHKDYRKNERQASMNVGNLTVPPDDETRKALPIATGVFDYFPDALLAIADVSRRGNDKHNPGEPLHWSRGKSNDDANSLLRHFVDRGKVDSEGIRHTANLAWRALAMLQREIDGKP